MLKDGMKGREFLGSSYCLSGWSGTGPVSGIRPWWNTFADTNGRPFVRCRPSSPRVASKPFALRRSAALRDARHFSARFNLRKMPAAATHRSICTDFSRLSIPDTRAYDLSASSALPLPLNVTLCRYKLYPGKLFCVSFDEVIIFAHMVVLWSNEYIVWFEGCAKMFCELINFISDWYWSNIQGKIGL